MAVFGDYNVNNWPLPHFGRGENEISSAEDWMRYVTEWGRGIQRTVQGAFGGPSFLESNIALMTSWFGSDDQNQGTQSSAGPPAHRMGRRVVTGDGQAVSTQQSVLEVVDVADASAGGSIDASGSGVLSVLSMRSGQGAETSTQPLVYLNNHVCGQGGPSKQYLIGSNTPFAVKEDGTVVAPGGVVECVWSKKIQIGQDPKGTEGVNTACTTKMEATANGLDFQGYDADTGDTTFHMSMSKAEGALLLEDGTDLILYSPDGTQYAAFVMTDDGTLGIVGPTKIDYSGIIDPSAFGFDVQASRPALTVPGLWADNSSPSNLYWYDGSTDNLITTGAGGGDHDVADSATNTSVKAVSLNHTTSGTAAIGFGVHMDWELEDAAGNVDVAGRAATLWGDATNGSEDAEYQHHLLLLGTLRETMRVGGNTATGIAGGGRFYVYADGTSTSPIADAMQYRVIDTNNSAPVDAWGGELNWILQRATDTYTTACRERVLWEDVSTTDSQWDMTVLQGGGVLIGAQILGKSGAFRLPNGILEFADQGTLGTPATGYGRLGYDVTADSARPRFVDQSGTETSLALLSDAGGGGDHDVSDSATSTISTAVDISHTTSGTASSGFGVRQTWTLEDSAGNADVASKVEVSWIDATNGSEDARYKVWIMGGASLVDGFSVEYSASKGSSDVYFFGDLLPNSDGEAALGGVDERWGTMRLGPADSGGAVSTGLTLMHTDTSTGFGVAGFGHRISGILDDDAGSEIECYRHDFAWTAPDTAGPDADALWSILVNGSFVEALRLDADGDGAGGTSTAVLVTQGRLDLAEQATPGTPPTARHRVYVDDETTFVVDDAGARRALDNVVLADAASEATQSVGNTSRETLKTVTLLAGYMATNGDAFRVRAAGRKIGTSGSNPTVFHLDLGGTAVASTTISGTTAARVWTLDAIVVRTNSTNCTTQTTSWWGASGSAGTVEVERSIPSITWANSLTINITAVDNNSEDSMTCDFLIVEPLIRA